jgi:hypothetical protein
MLTSEDIVTLSIFQVCVCWGCWNQTVYPLLATEADALRISRSSELLLTFTPRSLHREVGTMSTADTCTFQGEREGAAVVERRPSQSG